MNQVQGQNGWLKQLKICIGYEFVIKWKGWAHSEHETNFNRGCIPNASENHQKLSNHIRSFFPHHINHFQLTHYYLECPPPFPLPMEHTLWTHITSWTVTSVHINHKDLSVSTCADNVKGLPLEFTTGLTGKPTCATIRVACDTHCAKYTSKHHHVPMHAFCSYKCEDSTVHMHMWIYLTHPLPTHYPPVKIISETGLVYYYEFLVSKYSLHCCDPTNIHNFGMIKTHAMGVNITHPCPVAMIKIKNPDICMCVCEHVLCACTCMCVCVCVCI